MNFIIGNMLFEVIVVCYSFVSFFMWFKINIAHTIDTSNPHIFSSFKSNDLFNPNQHNTRAEFVAIIVRGLGLKLDKGASPFSDVKGAEWYASAIQTAYSYKLIDGLNDGTFRPTGSVTREQAITILAKAMEIIGLKAKLPAVEASESLHPFADADSVSKWEQAEMAACLQAGMISGRTVTQLAPKAFITRAEVAVIVQKLLQKTELMQSLPDWMQPALDGRFNGYVQ